jgi:hypothetical protein
MQVKYRRKHYRHVYVSVWPPAIFSKLGRFVIWVSGCDIPQAGVTA